MMKLTTVFCASLVLAGITGAVIDETVGRRSVAFDYWDAHGCINHLDGSTYEGTADKRSEFPKADVCREYVHIIGHVSH